jgi:polynucleotide 5'-kinase involved in rRNA processing
MRRLAEGRNEECSMRHLHAPEAWRQTAATILHQRPRTILVLGGGDAGKSSYCRFLVAQLLGAGEPPAIVDADCRSGRSRPISQAQTVRA